MLGASTSVGRWARSMVQAMVALLPDPVMPSSVWKGCPAATPAARASMALGWSPAGSNGATTSKARRSLGTVTGGIGSDGTDAGAASLR